MNQQFSPDGVAAPQLKPYVLPSLGELRVGARCGFDGGVAAGPVGSVFYGFILMVTTPGVLEAARGVAIGEILGCLMLSGLGAVVLGILGLIVGALLGPFVGATVYFLLTPWIPPELWPRIGQSMRSGMLYSSLICALISGGVTCTGYGSLILFFQWLPEEYQFLLLIVFALLPLVGFLAGGFVAPLCCIVLPHLMGRRQDG